MRASHDLGRVFGSFGATNLVPSAGLLPAAVLAQRLELAGLIDRRLKLAKHGASSGAKALTVIGAMLAGGDSIDDTVVLRAGAGPGDLAAPLTIDVDSTIVASRAGKQGAAFGRSAATPHSPRPVLRPARS